MESTTTLSYSDISQRERAHPLLMAEVPDEYDVSLPLPSWRWGVAAYACFAGPAVRRPRQPKEVGAPDRWWLLDARTARLVLYAYCRVMPFAPDAHWDRVTLPPETRSLASVKELAATVERLMNEAAPVFLAGGPPPASTALAEALRAYVPGLLWSRYQALTPDFFAWLHL